MRYLSILLFSFVVALAACGGGGTDPTSDVPENIDKVSQALVIDEYSPILDSDPSSPAPKVWDSAVGPDSWGNDPNYFEQQDSPGVCGITYISGGLSGFAINEYGYATSYVGMKPNNGPYGHQRWRLEVRPGANGSNYPKAQMHCVSLNKFWQVLHAPGALGAYPTYSQAGQYPGNVTSQASAAADGRQLNIWAGVYGSMMNSSNGNKVSKFFRSGDPTAHFFYDFTTGTQHRVTTVNVSQTGAPCPAVPSGTVTDCITRSFGYSLWRNNYAGQLVGWTRGVTDQMARVTNGVSNRRQIFASPLASNFCFLSGIAGGFGAGTTNTDSAAIVNGLVSGTIDLLVKGPQVEAAVQCIPYTQGPNG